MCAAALALRTRHYLRVPSGESGKEGAKSGDVTGVSREAPVGGAEDVALASAELEGRKRVRRGMGKGDGQKGVERTVEKGRCVSCKRGGKKRMRRGAGDGKGEVTRMYG